MQQAELCVMTAHRSTLSDLWAADTGRSLCCVGGRIDTSPQSSLGRFFGLLRVATYTPTGNLCSLLYVFWELLSVCSHSFGARRIIFHAVTGLAQGRN